MKEWEKCSSVALVTIQKTFFSSHCKHHSKVKDSHKYLSAVTHLNKRRGFSAPQGTPVSRKTWGEPLFPVVFPSGRLRSSHKPQRRPPECRPVGEVIEGDLEFVHDSN